MPIVVKVSGSFANTRRLLQRVNQQHIYGILEKYGPMGVTALAQATPNATGETANSWYYEITKSAAGFHIAWKNSHIVEGANIALLIQYGHGTGTGGYVPGRDYINPAMKPIFEQILAEVRRVVRA